MEKNNGQCLKNGFANQPIQLIHCILKGGWGGLDGEGREKRMREEKGRKRLSKHIK